MNELSVKYVESVTQMVIKELIGMGIRPDKPEPDPNYPPLQDKVAEQFIKTGVSARHVHLCRQAVDVLFGKDYELTRKSELMGGQYSCNECVTIVGANLRAMENVRILGPMRGFTQVEVAQTDAVRLGIKPPVRESGSIKGSAPISLIGPKGAVYLNEGCIIAMRHIHMSENDAAKFGVVDKEKVSIEFRNGRSGVLHDVLVRVDKSFTLEMHIDTDEANALGVRNGDCGYIIRRD